MQDDIDRLLKNLPSTAGNRNVELAPVVEHGSSPSVASLSEVGRQIDDPRRGVADDRSKAVGE